MPKTEAEWKSKLTPEQYHVLRDKGTEAPFSGKYDSFFEKGKYKCAACGAALFTSDTKYDSGCGWPAFFEANKGSILTKDDIDIAAKAVTNGPKDKGGKRYCVNSVALEFEKT